MIPESDTRIKSTRAAGDTAITFVVALSMIIVACPIELRPASALSIENAALVDSVDGDRMLSTVTDLEGFGSRAYLHDSMWNASIYIHDRFVDLGLSVSYQDFQVAGLSQRNVIAVMEGTDPDAPQYLFGAHYDSMTLAVLGLEEGNATSAPGADDDASGVAATIELATVLHEKTFNNTIKFVAFGAEETGLNGSTVFVQEERSKGVLYADTAIMDMIGYRASEENKAYIFRDTGNNRMAESVDGAIGEYGLNLSLTLVSGTELALSDHFPFWMAGYPSILVIEDVSGGWPVNPNYHTENDTVEHISKEQMTAVTQALLGGFLDLQNPSGGSRDSVIMFVALIVVLAAVVTAIAVYMIQRRRADE